MDMNTNMAMSGDFFNPGPFMPHGGCYLWTQSLIALHAVSDGLIVLSYYSIPFLLLYFMRRRKDVDWKLQWILGCFALFVLACGTTHLLEIWNIWHANYWLSGLSKAFTALVSMLTLFLSIKLLPHALALPSVADLQKVRDEQEVRLRERTAKLEENEAMLLESQRIASLGSYVTNFATGRWSSSEVLDQVFGIGPAYDRSVAGWAALIHPDDCALMVEYLEQEVIGRRQPFNKEYRIIRHNDQAERWVNGLGRMEFDAQGRPLKMFGTIQDITERKRVESALWRSEERYNALFNRSLDCVFLIDFAGHFLDANQASLDLFGYQREEISSITFASLLTEDQLPAAFQTVEEIKTTGRQQRLTEYRVRCKDGRQVYVETLSSLIQHEGKPFAIQGIARDITLRKEAEAAVQASEEKYRSLNISMTEGMALHELICDATGKPVDYVLLDVNPAFEKLTGLVREAVIGHRGSEVYGGEAPFLEVYAEVATTGQPINFEKAYEPMKKIFSISVFSPVKGRFATVFMDVTERKEMENSLRTSEARYRRLHETMRDAFGIVDMAGRLQECNHAFQAMLGYTEAELKQLSYSDLTPAKWQALDAQIVREQVLPRGYSEIYEKEYRRKDGSVFPINLRVTLISNGAGQATGMWAVVRDITEAKRAEAELKLFRTLVDQANDSFLVIDPETGRLLDVNEQGYLARGYNREEFLTLRVFDIDPTLRLGEFRKIQEELRTKGGQVWQGLNRRKDGSTFPVEVSLKYVKLDHDYIVADVRDITERQLVEKSHARLATAVEQAAETIVITDTAGNILYANPAFEQTTGYTRAEAFGRNPRLLKSGKHDAGFYRQMWEVLGRGEIWNGHFINKHKDGRIYEEEATISPVRDCAGKVVNYVAVKRDVTREVQLETQFRQTQKLEAIGTLASGVAHDFNNILAVISMQASLLKSGGGLSADQLKFADEINSTVDRAAALTRQLLLFSRREALQLRDLDWSESVTHTIKMLRRILGENIDVLLNLAVEPMFIHADAGMMEQVLMNLAVNARDAMPKGGRMVIATAAVEFDAFAAAQSAQARPGSFVCLSVTDNGCGISPEVLPKIFEPFFTTKDIGKGSGLGLATVFGIVQQHHGWINVYSEPGQGTTFKVYLPRLVGRNDQIIGQKMPAPIPTGKETILLVEDDPALRATVRITLARLGYRVLEAPTGVKALELWQEHGDEIHLLLTDLMMPDGMHGKELAQRLVMKTPKLKVIYMSGYSADILDKDFPVQIGVNFLAKPFQMAELAQIIRDSLDKPALPKKMNHG